MSVCPDDTALKQLIADTLSAVEQNRIDAHLTDCAVCRQRIEELTDVMGLSKVLSAVVAKSMTASAHLRLAIDRLTDSTSQRNGDGATLGMHRPIRGPLPQLQPTTRSGFIGRLGAIDIRRIIGRGGMGIVYEGLDAALDRVVAVKVLSPHLLADPEAKSRFLREARAAATLTHESVVAIHAIMEADGTPALVLQYIPGESLAQRIEREKKLPFDDVVRIGIQVSRGLAAAHEHGLVHRDIKPGNILIADCRLQHADWKTKPSANDDAISPSGAVRQSAIRNRQSAISVKIADFGLVKRVGAESITQEGILAGTPAYMSPEQAADADVDARSDLFSLGVVLYHISSGELPFPAESPFVLLNQVRTMEPRPLRDANPELPEWFCTIVHRLMAKLPEQRIGSAARLAELLERQTAVAPLARRRPYRWMSIAIGLAALVLAGIGVIQLISNENDVPPPMIGFVVDGVAKTFTTLAEAVDAAPDNGTILVHGAGPYSSSTIKIENKRLTIRAAPGHAPKFVPAFKGKGGPTRFLYSNSDLTVEGLDADWPNPAPPLVSKEDASARCVMGVTQNRLTVLRCRVTCGEFGICVGANSSDLLVSHCHLSAPNVAACIGWRPTSSQAVQIEHCLLEGHIGFFIGQSELPDPTAMTIENNTVVADRAIRFVLDAAPKQIMNLTARRNVFDCPVVVSLIGMRNYAQNLNTHAGMTDVVRKTATWTESANIYRKDTVYLCGNRPGQLVQYVPSRLKKLDQWLEFWNLSNTQSIDGTIRRDDRGVIGVDGASGPIPPDVGVLR